MITGNTLCLGKRYLLITQQSPLLIPILQTSVREAFDRNKHQHAMTKISPKTEKERKQQKL